MSCKRLSLPTNEFYITYYSSITTYAIIRVNNGMFLFFIFRKWFAVNTEYSIFYFISAEEINIDNYCRLVHFHVGFAVPWRWQRLQQSLSRRRQHTCFSSQRYVLRKIYLIMIRFLIGILEKNQSLTWWQRLREWIVAVRFLDILLVI